MPRKSKYEVNYDNRATSYSKKSYVVKQKVWNIGKYIRLSREDDDEKDESNSIVSQNKILDDLIRELAFDSQDEYVVYDTYADDRIFWYRF